MYNKIILFVIMSIIIVFKTLFAFDPDSLQKAISLKINPYYSEAQSGLLPKGFVNKGDTATIFGIQVDTVGIPWFQIKIKKKVLWSPVKYWQYVSEIDTAAFIEGKQSAEDKKRRLRILREHKDWPRRIIRAVRFGRICLDMDREQLIASWDKPFQKTTAFTIGLGKHSIWMFKGKKDNIAAVLIKNGRIIGWTIK